MPKKVYPFVAILLVAVMILAMGSDAILASGTPTPIYVEPFSVRVWIDGELVEVHVGETMPHAPTNTPATPPLSPTPSHTPLPPTDVPLSHDWSLRAGPRSLNAEAQDLLNIVWEIVREEKLPIYPDPEPALEETNSYRMRVVDQHISALSLALRVTGDVAFVEEIWRLTEIARANLKDPDGDGFMNFVYWYNCGGQNAQYCGRDNISLEENLIVGTIAHWTYVMWINQDLDPRYADAANWWLSWLTNQQIPKWIERKGSLPWCSYYDWACDLEDTRLLSLSDPKLHPYSSVVRGLYYVGRMTGSAWYTNEAKRRADVLYSMIERVEGGLSFDHWVVGLSQPSYGPHPTTYALHTFVIYLDLALEGFAWFDDELPALAATWANILKRADVENSTMPNDLKFQGSERMSKYAFGVIPAFAAWDSTGTILSVTQRYVAQYHHPGYRRTLPVFAGLLFAAQAAPSSLSMGSTGPTSEPDPYITLYTDGSWGHEIAPLPTSQMEATVTPWLVPTQETFKTCQIKIRSPGLNVRTGPGTDLVTTLQPGEVVEITGVRAVGAYIWAEHSIGWSAIFLRAAGEYMVDGVGDPELCYMLPGWPSTPIEVIS